MNWSQFRRPTFWWLAGLLGVAAFVRFRGIRFGLPYTQARPDETAIIDPVRVLLSGHLPHFYDYPWLFLWIVAIAYVGYFLWGAASGTFQSMSAMLASWPIHWEPFFLIPRVISAVAGTLSVLIVFRLGRQVRDETTAIVSALFFALASMHVRGSHFGTTDVVMTGLIVAAVVLLIDAHRTRRRGQFLAAGLVAGLAAATKYNAVLLGVPMLVSHVLNVWDSPPATRRQAWLDPGILYFCVPFLFAFAVGVPFVVLDRVPFLDAMRELTHALRVGDVRMDLGNGWLYHLTFSLRYGMGVPLLVAGLAGAGLLLWMEPRTGLLLLSFPIAYYVVAGSIRLLFVRYAMPVVPFLCVTAAYLVCRSATWVTSRAVRSVDQLKPSAPFSLPHSRWRSSGHRPVTCGNLIASSLRPTIASSSPSGFSITCRHATRFFRRVRDTVSSSSGIADFRTRSGGGTACVSCSFLTAPGDFQRRSDRTGSSCRIRHSRARPNRSSRK
ncbi:MAG TPA: glycosyltransferase family 39 protein [Vicinamibacterales bacterium]